MTIYIALLRGINVGGKNIIKMADLKKAFENIGLSPVQTYIQSGNIILSSHEEKDILQKKIEDTIQITFGFQIPAILRTVEELKELVSACPFSEKEILAAETSSKVESLYVAFLAHTPSQENLQRLDAYKNETETYNIIGKDIYLLFHNSIRNAKLANNLSKLNVHSTIRNWKTINKLLLMAQQK